MNPENRIDNLAEAISYLANNADIRRDFGDAGLENAKKYDIEKIVDHWEGLILRVGSSSSVDTGSEFPNPTSTARFFLDIAKKVSGWKSQ